MAHRNTKIAVDFDGTIVEHKFPDIGRPVPDAVSWLKRFKEHGATLILWTMRSDDPERGMYLTHAVEWCRKHGIEFDAINEGLGDRSWTNSPKAHANAYIDDANAGCPLRESTEMGARPMVNWDIVGQHILDLIESRST